MAPGQNKTPTDEALITRYRQGDPEAFPTLFSRYQGKVFLLVRGYFSNRERAEEVFQEVFLKVIERMESFDSSGSFKSWFLTLCRNHCIDRLRQQARRPEVPDSSLGDGENPHPGSSGQAPDKGATPEQTVYSKELAALLQIALEKLPEEQRETFLLKERMGLTFEEIAQMMGVPVNTVKSRMRYALESLRRALKGKTFAKEALK